MVPADLPLNWLLKERQVPHRLVNHPTAEIRPYTRMQARVLDHARLIDHQNIARREPVAALLPAVLDAGDAGEAR